MAVTQLNPTLLVGPGRWCVSVLLLLPLFGLSRQASAQGAAATSTRRCPDARLLGDGCRTLELTGLYFVEAWDLNGRPRDQLWGGTVGLSLTVRESWGTVIEWLGGRVARQKPPGAALGGLTVLVRKRLAHRRTTDLFVEGGAGGSYGSVEVPDRGTRFNYLLQGGGGVARRLGPGTSAIVSLRLLHLSNNSLKGPNHNPDIQAFGAHAGIVIGF